MASQNVETHSSQAPISAAPQRPASRHSGQENFADYVAELQLHMSLQAKNLVPSMGSGQTSESRASLLHETQAMVEKQISRQV